MPYEITIKASAEKEIAGLPKPIAARVLERIDALTRDPRPPRSSKLSGVTDLWRIRVGDYRVVYHVDDSRHLIEVRIVAHRRHVYRGI